MLSGVLDAGTVAEVNRAVDEDSAGHPSAWDHFSNSFIQAVDLSVVLARLESLLGADVTFAELSVISRNPTREGSDYKS